MTRFMTHQNIPIHLRFLRVPAVWEIRTIARQPKRESVEFAFSKIQSDGSLDAFRVSELDAWKCREEFFNLPKGDNGALLKFLTKMGVWLKLDGKLLDHWSSEVMQHYREGHPIPIDIRGLWKFREGLRHSLVSKRAFREIYAPHLSSPKTGLELMRQSRTEFPLRFELANVALGVVTLTDTYHMLLATVFLDVASGLRFRFCERSDCGNLFPVESRHEKKFCCWYCAHITTVRRNRPHKGRKRLK